MKNISIIVPVFNENDGIKPFCDNLDEIIGGIDAEFEIVLIDDGSSDGSAEAIEYLVQTNPRISSIHFSRNFGKEAAIFAGIEHVSGDAAIIIDADFQHPPELIADMIAFWRDGYDVVEAVKRKRVGSSALSNLMATIFNRIIGMSTGRDMSGASDFKLLDRQVIDTICSMPEKNRFFRGLVAWVGFNVKQIDFDTRHRHSGVGKWSFFRLFRYATNNIISFTSFPLIAVGIFGILISLLGFTLLIQTIINYALDRSVEGFTTVIAIQLTIGGLILISLGIIAIYLSKIFNEIKRRPIYIVKKNQKRS